jgi:hypothetical protein
MTDNHSGNDTVDEANMPETERDGRDDFDFHIGRWDVHHRVLRGWQKGSTTWDEFEGTSVHRPILGGVGNIDEYTMESPLGRREGVAIRLFDPASRQWSIYWANGVLSDLGAPSIGGFTQGRGEFYSFDPFEGKHVIGRILWSEITATSCRWEQAFSADGGRTWETNWIMGYTRQRE